jgi:hypothetical protein
MTELQPKIRIIKYKFYIKCNKQKHFINHGLRTARELTNIHWCLDNRIPKVKFDWFYSHP